MLVTGREPVYNGRDQCLVWPGSPLLITGRRRWDFTQTGRHPGQSRGTRHSQRPSALGDGTIADKYTLWKWPPVSSLRNFASPRNFCRKMTVLLALVCLLASSFSSGNWSFFSLNLILPPVGISFVHRSNKLSELRGKLIYKWNQIFMLVCSDEWREIQ